MHSNADVAGMHCADHYSWSCWGVLPRAYADNAHVLVTRSALQPLCRGKRRLLMPHAPLPLQRNLMFDARVLPVVAETCSTQANKDALRCLETQECVGCHCLCERAC